MVNVFAVPIFFICLRETIETVIIVSILLSFLKQQIGPNSDPIVYKKLRKQVWFGTGLGLAICIVVGCGLIGAFYGIGVDHWAGTEEIWEGTFALIAAIVITIMGAALLRVSKLQAKWRVKLAKALETKHNAKGKLSHRLKIWAEKYAMFILPFITVLREGLEAVVFIGGVSLGLPASSIPLAAITGLAAGCLIGFILYKVGNSAPLQIFLIVSTCFLYLVAAGLFSKSVWYFEQNDWNKATGGDAGESGSGPGSYDIRRSVWHVNCCSPELNGGGGWGIFNALFGWTNSATYGSVISYNLYWIVVMAGFIALRFREKRGRWPFMKAKRSSVSSSSSGMVEEKSAIDDSSSDDNVSSPAKGGDSVDIHQRSEVSHA